MARKEEKKYDIFLHTVRKYAPAICTCLYPSQTRELKAALEDYQKGHAPYIRDAFVNLAYEMVIADYEWQLDYEAMQR